MTGQKEEIYISLVGLIMKISLRTHSEKVEDLVYYGMTTRYGKSI